MKVKQNERQSSQNVGKVTKITKLIIDICDNKKRLTFAIVLLYFLLTENKHETIQTLKPLMATFQLQLQ